MEGSKRGRVSRRQIGQVSSSGIDRHLDVSQKVQVFWS